MQRFPQRSQRRPESLISTYSGDSPLSVAEAAITAAGDAGASAGAIGSGMATAALAEGTGIGTQIADAVGSTGTAGTVSAFQSTALASNTPLGQRWPITPAATERSVRAAVVAAAATAARSASVALAAAAAAAVAAAPTRAARKAVSPANHGRFS